VVNLSEKKTARRRIGEVLAEDELHVEAALYVRGVLWEGPGEGGREGGRKDKRSSGWIGSSNAHNVTYKE